MPRRRSPFEDAAGKLISAIQKEWGKELGEAEADRSEEVMNRAHELLQARTPERASAVLRGRSVFEFLGAAWIASHPSVALHVARVQAQLDGHGQ